MTDLTVNIVSVIGPCAEFTNEYEGKEEVSVVISPLKVTQEDSILRVNSGCNLWKACKNSQCHFSLIAHTNSNKKS